MGDISSVIGSCGNPERESMVMNRHGASKVLMFDGGIDPSHKDLEYLGQAVGEHFETEGGRVVVLTSPLQVAKHIRIGRSYDYGSEEVVPRDIIKSFLPDSLKERVTYSEANHYYLPEYGHLGVLVIIP